VIDAPACVTPMPRGRAKSESGLSWPMLKQAIKPSLGMAAYQLLSNGRLVDGGARGSAAPGVELWSQDDGRIGQQGSLARIRAERGRCTARRCKTGWSVTTSTAFLVFGPSERRRDGTETIGRSVRRCLPARGVGAELALPRRNVYAMVDVFLLPPKCCRFARPR
jgi:hypothetical protein